MKTDTQKLKEIFKVIKKYRKSIDDAAEEDSEVTFGGNGINWCEADLTFSAFEKDIAEAIKD